MKRPTRSRLQQVTADCEACEWTVDARNGLGAAARHHDHTGHPVTTRVVRIVEYGTFADLDRAREAAGQVALGIEDDR